jgi:hypothetical protein
VRATNLLSLLSDLQFAKFNMASVPEIPPSGTWFDTLKRSFVDVPVDEGKDNGISTTEFLEAAESLTTLFGTIFSRRP